MIIDHFWKLQAKMNQSYEEFVIYAMYLEQDISNLEIYQTSKSFKAMSIQEGFGKKLLTIKYVRFSSKPIEEYLISYLCDYVKNVSFQIF